VEFFHNHTNIMKVLGCTNWTGEAFNLAREGLLVCTDKFNFSPLDYGAKFHFEVFNLSKL
jgi:hypothetical protein